MAEEHDGDWDAQSAGNGTKENRPHEGAEDWGESRASSQGAQREDQSYTQHFGTPDNHDGDADHTGSAEETGADGNGEADGDGSGNNGRNDAHGNADDDSSQTAVIEQGIPAAAAPASSEQATTQIEAAGSHVEQSTVQQPTVPLYRPAPEYGAYGPVPAQPQNGNDIAGGAQSYGQPQPNVQHGGQPTNGQQGSQGSRNPYFGTNPFLNPDGQRSNAQFGSAQPDGQGRQGYNPGNTPQGPQTPQGQGYPPQGLFTNSPASRATAPNRSANAVVAAVVAALVSAALCLGIGYAAVTNGWVKLASTSSLSSVGSSQSSGGSAPLKSGASADWTAVSNAVSGSVVAIQTQVSGGVAKGSGAILDAKGHIVTNNHVISGAQQIQVTLANGQIYTAQLVGADATTDLAVIKLDNPPSDLKPVQFADSASLAVGQGVMAIGNPLGYDDTATTGIVSALNRPVSVSDDNGNAQIVTNAVQIDAAINPGNSGGPTFDASGKVIGINSSIASTATTSSEAGSIGIGFAIPSNLVKRVSQEIIDNGSVKHVQLGVTISDATAQADGVTRGGTKIASVVSGSPADKAGLKVGDTIVAFNDQAVNNTYSLLGYVRASALNDKVKLTVVRDSKAIDVDVTLDQQEPASTGSQSSNGNSQNNNGNNDNGDGNGFTDPFGQW
ncbi:MAG: trypsin-like peptidase domain-containing protein [Bifidobacterium sp.]|jgi:putative serine protease PepD|nr:trypsin-like peptidase domain-containing protein [Bifidobacterium sp.]